MFTMHLSTKEMSSASSSSSSPSKATLVSPNCPNCSSGAAAAGIKPISTTSKKKNLSYLTKKTCGVILVCFLSTVIYLNSLDGDFVHDDIVSIVRNPDVRSNVTPWTKLWKNDFWGMPMASPLSHKSYRPLTTLSFRLNFAMTKEMSAFWFHVTNVWIHASTSVLVYFMASDVLRMCFSSSLTTSVIFALHPIHTEAVSGITGRSDVMSCFLMLISFLLYTKSLEPFQNHPRIELNINNNNSTKSSICVCSKNMKKGISWRIILAGIIGCSAMLAKETGITIMAINILYDLYIHQEIVKRWLSRKFEDQMQSNLKKRITFMCTLVFISLSFRLAIMNGTSPRFSQLDNPAASSNSNMTRLLTYAFLPVFNTWLMLCPSHLSYDWQMGSIPLVEVLWDPRNLSTGIFYLLYFCLWFQCFLKEKRKSQSCRTILVAMLFISLPFLPASNLLFPVGFVAAERVLYAPSIGVSILTAHGIELLKKKLGRRKEGNLLVYFLLCFMLINFAIKTWTRNTVWKSRTTLFESGLRENSRNAKVHYNYANLQKDLGNTEAAVKHYKIALSLEPDYASAHNNLGALTEDFKSAEECFIRAIQINPQHNGAHFNLGVIYMRNERYKDALKHLEECLKIDPSHVEALQYLGACYNVLNKTHEAENVFHKLISSDLPPSKLHTNFGLFLQELGRSSEALKHYLIALTKTTWNIQALFQAAKLASKLGSQQLFVQLSQQLLSLQFDSGIAHLLAINYKENGKLLEANSLFERLVEESNSFYKIHYAQFLMDARRWSDAEETLKGIPRTHPDHATSILLLATLLENQNRTAEAFDTLHAVLGDFCPHDPVLCAQFYSHLGNLMHSMGAIQSAANYYKMAINFNPNSVQAHTNIGAIYHLMNEFDQAHRHYKTALTIEPTNSVIRNNIEKLKRAKFEYPTKNPVVGSSSGNDLHFVYR